MAEFGEDIAVSLVPDFTRFDQEYRAEIERLQRNAVSIPVSFQIDKDKLKADLEAAAKELGRTTEIRVQVKLDTTAARAELARLRSDASMSVRGGAGGYGGGGVGRAGLLGAGLVAGAAFAPGIVGAGLGAGAGLGVGVLGYQGLHAQAAQGTGFGAGINNEINQIKASFASLGQTAADALGPGVSSALDKVRQALPGLAPEVAKLGSSLGTVADQLGTGLVNVLQSSGPVIDAFGEGIAKLATDFARFTGSDQFQQFIADSAKQLPQLVTGLEGAARVLGDVYQIVRPLAPLLAITAGAMSDLADALAKLPDPAKLALVAALVGGTLAGRGGRGGGGGGLLGGRGTADLLALGLGVSSYQSDNPAVSTLGPAAAGAFIGSRFGPLGAAFGGAAGLGIGAGKTIYEQFFQQTVTGQGRIAPSARPPVPLSVFPDYELGRAGIDPTSDPGKALRGALTAILPSRAGMVPALDALDQRYGPAIQAMQSYRTAQQQVQSAVQSENQVEVQGAAEVSAAQASLTQAREQAARTAVADAQQIQNAERAVADARRNAARVAGQSADAIAGAEQQIIDAQEAAQAAQENLLQARKDAARQLVDMARAAVDSGDALQSAQLRLEQLQLQQAARLGTKTPEEIYREQNQLINRGTTLDLKSAQDAVTDAQITHTRAVRDNNTAQKRGVEGSPGVVAAKKAVADANDTVAASEKNLARVRQNAADAERTANRQVADSVKALAAVRVQAAQDRADAEDQVAAAVKGVQTAEQNAKQADDDAHQRTLDIKQAAKDAGDAFDYQAAKVGLTRGELVKLSTAIDQGKFDLVASFKDKGTRQVMQDTIDIQRELYEAVLIAGGATPAEAARQAAGRLLYPKPHPAPSTSRTPGIPQATGGPIYGPGGPTDDLAGLYALSAGEHVWTAKEVANAGGHKAVERMRGLFRGLADGGSPWDATLTLDYSKMGLLNTLKHYTGGVGPAGGLPSGRPVILPGGTGELAIWRALRANGLSAAQAAGVMGNMQSESGFNPFIVQGGGTSMNPAAAGSGGYGLVQWTPGSKLIPYLGGQLPGIGTEVAALIAQLRGLGSSPEGAAGAALRQATTPANAAAIFGLQYERYAGGIQLNRSAQAEAIYAKYKGLDGGGVLPPGVTVAVNSSTKPEAVLTNSQWRLLKSLANGRRAPVMHVENQTIQSPAEADALVRMLQFAALAAGGGGL